MGLQFRDDSDRDQFFALRTFRRDGTAVSTPIWLAPVGERWYGYTPTRSGKAKRIRRDGHVEVAPSDFEGHPQGPWQVGQARILERRELRFARCAMMAKYGMKFRLFLLTILVGRRRRSGGRGIGLEIVLDRTSPAPG